MTRFLPLFLASSITSFMFLTFVSCHAGIFQIFLIFPLLPLHPFFFNAWGIGINLCTKWWRLSEFIPFAAMWSSWYRCGIPSNRILTDSLASTIQADLVLFSQCCCKFHGGNLLVLYKALVLASEFPTFYERFSWCVWILHLIQWRRYHVFVWHYRSLVSR